MKRVMALTLTAALMVCSMFAFTGCDLKKGENGELDLNAVVATVGGEKILMSELKAQYDMYVEYYTNYGYDITSDPDTLAEFKTTLLERIVSEKAALLKAKEEGLGELNEERQAEVDALIQEELDAIEEYYMPQAENEAAENPDIDVEARYKELVAAESAEYAGREMNYDEYMAYLRESIRNNYLIELYKEKVVYTDIKLTEEDIVNYYNELVEAARETYGEDAAAYKDDQDYAEQFGEIPAAYIPEGYSRVMHILIPLSDEMPKEYTDKISTMGELEHEYGDLAFEDAISGAKKNAARMKEILSEYKALKEETDAQFEQANTDAKTKIEEAYQKLQDGTAFAEVMAEYTEDSNFKDYETIAKNGMLISSEYTGETDWSKSIKAEFAKLTVGAYSEVFEDEEGYHIIFYVGDETAGDRDMEEMRSFIEIDVMEQKKIDEWNALIDAWMESDFVKIDEEQLSLLK